MAFDVDGAIKAGYKIDEIADHLGKKAGFDVGAARQSGYSDDEIVEYLRAGKPAKTPQQKTAKAEPPPVADPSIEDATTSAPTPERRSTEVINPEWRNAPKQSLISRGLNIVGRALNPYGTGPIQTAMLGVDAAKRALSPYDTTETMSPADIASAQIARETGKGWSTVVDPARRIEKGFAPIPRLAAAGLKQSEGGAIRGIAEMEPNVRSAYLGPVAGPLSMLVPQKAWQKIGEAGQSYANEGVREHQKVKEEYPVEIGTPESMMQTAGQSMLEQAVPMAASVVTGNPAPALLAMSGMTAARDYHGFRERGHSPEVAAIASTATGAIEGATELLPVGAFLKLAGGKQALVKSLVGLYGSEIPGEMIATVTQDMIDKSMVRPNMTVGEMGQEIKKYFTSGEAALMQKETIGSAGIQTTLMGMAGSTPRILSRAANRINGTDPITQGMTISSPAASGMPQLTEEQAARRNKLSGIMENDTEADAQARLQAIEARKRGEVSQGAEGTSSTVPESEQVAAEPVDMTEPVAPAEPEKEVQQSGKKDLSSLEARHAKLKVKIFDEEGNQREGVSQKAIDNYNALTATIESQRAEHAKPAIRPEASGLTGADASVMDGFTKTSMKAPVPPSSNVEAGEDEQHFRVVPAKTPLGEVQDHWTTTKIDDARQVKQSLEESNGEPYQIVEIDGQAVEAAGGKSKGKSPYGTGANWVKTDKTVTPDAVVGVVDSDDVKTKVMNRIDGILPETSPSGHPQTKQHLADVINSEELPGGNVTVADIEAAGRNIKANGAPQTDIERALVRVLADDVRSNRHKYEVKTQAEQGDAQPRKAEEKVVNDGKPRSEAKRIEHSSVPPETRRKNLEAQLAVSRHPKDRERIQKALEKLKGKTRAISEAKRAKKERDDRAADAENQVRLQKLGQEHVPGVRAQDAAEAGRMWEMKENGDVSAQEWYDYVADLVASNKVSKAADPNIGREWNATYGRQRIVAKDTTGPNPLYDVLTVETGAIRRYDASRIEDIVRKDEHHLTPEYEAEQKEQKESARLRAERDARQAEKDKQIADEIAAFTAGMSNMAAGKAKAALLKQIRFSNGVMTRKKYVEERIAEGRTVTGEGSERRLEDADGVGLGEKKLSKTGMDYAEFLLGRKEAEYGSQQGKPEEETKVRQLAKDIRKQRVEEFKKKYGYAEDTEKTASQNAPENPAKTPATPKAISEMKNLSSEDLDAIFEEESEKSVESQTAEEDAFTLTPYEATPYNRLLETLVAHGEPGRIKKEEGDGFTTTSYTVTIPNAKVSRFIDDVTEDGFVWVDDEYDEDHDTKTLTLEFNQRMTAPVKHPPAPEVKQSGEEKFNAIRRKHLEKQLGIVRSASEKAKLEKALARLKGKKQKSAAEAGEKPATDNREEPYFKKGERVQLSYDGSHGEVFESSTMIMKSFTIGRRGVEGDTREYVHSYRVKKDNGVITLASFSEMQHEISPAPEVVPAPVVPPKGEAMEPDRLLTQISNTRGYAKNRRAAATRARKQEKKDAYRREAEQYDKEADELQAVLDAWAEKYPKEAAKVLPPKQGSPEAKQAQQNADTGMTFHETKHTKYGHDLFVVSLDERVEAAEYQRLKREAESLGGYYSSFKGRGAIPGFQFREKDKAEQFMREQGGVKAKASDGQRPEVVTTESQKQTRTQVDYQTFMASVYTALDDVQALHNAALNTPQNFEIEYMAQYKKAITETWMKLEGQFRTASEAFNRASKNTAEMLRPQMNRYLDRFAEQRKAQSGQAKESPEFKIGDYVEPIRDKDVLKPGVVQHVQTDRDGNQYIQVGSRHWNAADFKKVEAGQAGKPSEQAEQVKESPEQTKTASDILQAAAAEGFRGMEEAAKGLHELFGGASLKFGLGGIDEETYAKAKPHFQAALNSVIEAGKGVREFFRFLIDNFGAEIKPYVMRFVEDIKNGPQGDSREERGREVSEVGDEGVQSSEQNGEHAGRPGTGADAGVLEVSPSEDVGATSEDGDSEGAGARPGREVSGVDQEIHGSGNVLDGRDGTSRTGVATSGTGKRGGGTGRRRNVTVPGTNYHINNPDKLIGGTPKVRFAKNKAAIEAYQSVTSEGRQPTLEELDAMAAYTGWGSFGQELFKGSWEHPMPKPEWEKESNWLRAHLGEQAWKSAQNSIINAHYTDPPTVMAMWEIARRLGFKGGRVLEPSMGIGNFFGLMPADIAEKCKLAGIELDDLTGGMAKLLYPQANIQIKGYQESKTADNFYDLVIGNWPFAQNGPADRRYRQISPSLHDYFFLKALDQVRPGGFVIGVTSSGTMDKIGKLTRLELAKKGDLIAAFRLPSGAFEQYAGTSVVTDIIVLQKRETPNVNPQDAGWINVSETEVANGVINTNEYWAAHPNHVLGVMDFGHGTTRGRPGMIVNRPENFASLLKGIVKKVPENIYNERAQTEKVISYITNNTKDRQQSVTVGPDGGLYVVQGEYLAPLHEVHRYKVEDKKETARREKQIGKLVEIRKAYGALIDGERAGSEETDSLRKDLAAKYDAFVKAHGDINKSYGLDVLRRVGEPFYPVLAALEMGQKNADGSVTYRGAKVLRESTMRAKRTIENPTVEDAYVLSRNESLSLDMNRIAELSGKAVEDVTKELLDNGTIYLTPAGNYEASDVYLSGNVRLKLREAEAAQADGMDMARNIEELKKIIPPDQPYYKIETKLGSPWVKVEHYQQFVAGMLNEQNLDGIDIYFHLGTWKVKFTDRSLNHKPEATTVWGHKDYPFNKLFQSAMNNAAVTIRTKDKDGNIIVDRVATEEVNDKIERIREEFTSWVWKDTARKFEVEKEYNELMNAVADTKFDGSFLTFAGMSLAKGESPFSLRKHQSDAIWRGLVNQAGLYAHEVGTGKTFTIGGLAVESRRYGIAKKPLIFAHNANSASVAEEVQSMYPAAKVLYVDNLAPDKIDVTMRQIANDDWDAVIVPHSLINRFALTRETLMTIAAEEIAAMEQEAIEAAEEDGESLSVEDLDDEDAIKSLRSVTAKELVHARNRIIKKIDEMAMRASRENAVSFEQLGVDMIIVDEAHQFKKPPITTKMRMKGLNKGTSGQSLALHLLTTYVKSLNAGKGVHLFTGTPITNTLTEIYHMQRYIMGDEMARVGVKAWDPWFGSFADSVGDVEITAAGDYEATTRLAAIVNAPELRRMIGQYMDIVFADDMPEFKPRTTSTGKTTKDKDLSPEERAELSTGRSENPQGRPYKKVITETCPMGRQQERILQDLKDLALHFRNASPRDRKDMIKSGHPASPVLVETAAANAGLDVRLVNKDAEYEPEGKVGKCIENLLKIYKEHDKATQVIFMERGFSDRSTSTKTHRDGTKTRTVKERFNLAKFLVDALVEGGIPREEIAIVDGKTSREKRKEIADAMNLCKVRVVIGNTQTLGTGVNMQENLRAIHHLDAPWMPGEMEQRNGRGWRQGNKWNTVLEIRYVTEGLDGRRWQVLVIKDRFIKSFLKGNDDTRVIEGDVMSVEEDNDLLKTLSEAAGDPRILLREKYRKDIEKLQRRQRVHEWGIMDAESAIARTVQDIKQIGIRRDILKQIIDHYEGNKGDSFSFTLGKETYTERKKAQTALDKRLLKLGKFADHEKIGEIYGFDITARWSQFNDQYEIRFALPGVTDVTTNGDNRQSLSYIRDLLDAKPSVASMEAILRNLHKHFDPLSDRRTSLEESLKSLEVAAKEPFPRAADLAKKEELLRNLTADMEANPVPPPSWLRNGAPAGGEVYVDGKAYVVAGHKWSNDGYFVKIEKGEGTEDIPYLAVTDENGEAVYAEREFTPPVIPRATQQQQNSDPAATPSDNERRFHKTRAVSGTKASDVKEVVAPLLPKWRNAPKVVVVQSESDLPANVIADIASQNAQGENDGVFTEDGSIYLIADNIARKEDAVRTLLHEAVGHYGLRGFLGVKFKSLLQDVYYLYGEKGLRDIANRYDLDLSNPDDRLVAAEEKLAELAESGEKPGLIRRAIAMIREWLRSIGVDISLSDNDVKAIISRAARWVERGLEDGRDDKGDTPRYSRRNRTGDPDTDAVLDKIGRPDKTIMERIRDIIKERAPLRVEQGLFDQFASIKQYDETAYIMTRMTTGFSDTFMAMLEHGAPIWANGWVKVDSRDNGIMKIFEPVAEDLDLFLGWMVGERAQKLMNEGRENYFTQAEINKLKALKTQENAVRWENVRINYVQYKKKVLDFAEQAGVINSEARRVWDHEEYVPFYRIAEKSNGTSKVQGPRGKRGIASQHSGIRTLKGGTSQLGDVFENILQNFSHLVHASIKNRAATEALRAAEAAGAASKVKWDWKAAHVETKQIVKKIREELGADDILEDEEDQLDDFLTLFYLARPKGTAIVHYLEDGKPKYYEVHDDLLLRSLTNINSQPFQGYFMDLARMTKRLMTVGITSMPGFMVRNIARDTVHVAAISGTNFIPVVSSMQGFMKAFREDDDMMQLMAAGGSFHGGWAYGHDMKKAADHAKHLMRKRGINSGVIDSMAKLWDAYQKVGAAMENAARVKVYDLELRDTGDHLRAAYKAKDLMDFSLHGDWKAVKFLCETVIFLQARIQSLHRLGRTAGSRQQLKSMAVVGTSIALASVLLYLFNRDDDRYKELEEWDKDTFWHFWIGEHHFRFPKPFEVGALFGTMAERITELAIEEAHDGKLFASRLYHMLTQTFALGLPHVGSELYQQAANKDSFTGRPIVNSRLKGMLPEDQKEPWTSETAIALAKVPGPSLMGPKRLEHFIEGYTGTLGAFVMGCSDMIIRKSMGYPDRPAMTPAEYPIVGSFYRGKDDRGRNTKYVTEFYNLMNEVDETYRSVQGARQLGNAERYKEIVSDEKQRDLLNIKKPLDKRRKAFTDINRETRRIYADREMTPKQKRERLNELTGIKNDIAKDTIRRIEAAGISIPR